ncbi:DUF932 domain-containing protein [Longispora sp. NPDC051575]|uniref:DUF932 domain-containing protein n=1 Tax=Longispora sp. NPDC051575 TaxID=3154943 RepID=UPI003415192B
MIQTQLFTPAEATHYGDGTSVTQVAGRVGPGRFPAFHALARATGGWYAENTEGMSVERAMQAANLPARVDFQPFDQVPLITEAGVESLSYPGSQGTYAIYPDGTRRGLGTVRKRYTIVQPEELAALGEAITYQSDGAIVAAGSYGDPVGSRMFLAFKLPEGFTVGGEDLHDRYFTLINSFDGSTSLRALFAPLRLTCTNQVEATFGKLANRVDIRHTGKITDKIDRVLEALRIAYDWTAAWKVESEKLLATPMNATEVTAFVDKLMPTPATTITAKGEKLWTERRSAIIDLALRGENNDFGRGSAYAVNNAVSEFADHHAQVRAGQGTNADRQRRTTIRRAVRLLDADAAALKVRATNLLLASA